MCNCGSTNYIQATKILATRNHHCLDLIWTLFLAIIYSSSKYSCPPKKGPFQREYIHFQIFNFRVGIKTLAMVWKNQVACRTRLFGMGFFRQPEHNHTTTKTPKHNHKNTTTPPHKNTTAPPQKHKTQPQKHHHTTTKIQNTKTPSHHHKNTTTPPQKHNRTTTKTQNTTTKTSPHHHKNTKHKNTITPPQKHNHTTTKTPPHHHKDFFLRDAAWVPRRSGDALQSATQVKRWTFQTSCKNPFRSLCRWNSPYPSFARDVIGCRDTCDESVSAGVIDAINVLGNTTSNNKCNEKSGETRPSEVRVYRMHVSWRA